MSNELVAKSRGQLMKEAMPDFISEDKQELGMTELMGYIRPPFLKIMQGSSDKQMLETFPQGTLILVPDNSLVLAYKSAMLFTPLYFFVEYLKVNPLEWKGQEPMIAERTYDKNNIIAKKALDKNLRQEQVGVDSKGKPLFVTYQEVLSFFIAIHSATETIDGPVLMSFARGEWRTGANFNRLIAGRGKSIFAGVYEASVGIHDYAGGQYNAYGLDIDNPQEASPWVADKAMYESFKASHEMLDKAFKERRIQAAYDEPAATEAPAAPDGEAREGDNF